MANKKLTKKKKEDNGSGTSLDDAFGDDSGVEYAESKPRKEKRKKGVDEEELDSELEDIEKNMPGAAVEQGDYEIKASKPIAKLKKGDKIKIDSEEYEVDSHYCMIDHKTTKEMAIEIFSPATDKDYQIRYFDDQVDTTMELYELQEILYVKRVFKKIEW